MKSAKLVLLIVAILVLCSPAFAQGASFDAAKYWSAVKSGKFSEAIGIAEKASAPNAYILINGVIYSMLGDIHRFNVSQFRYSVASLETDDLEAVLGEVEGKYSSANAEAVLGVLYWESGERDKAVACLEKALKLDSKNAYALNYLGMQFYEKDNQKYLEYSQKALRQKKDYSEAYNNAAAALMGLGKAEEAYKILLTSLKETKLPHPNTYHNLIGVAGKGGLAIKSRRGEYTIEEGNELSDQILDELYDATKKRRELFCGIMDCFLQRAMYGEAQYFLKKAKAEKLAAPVNFYYANVVYMTNNDGDYDGFAQESIRGEDLDYQELYTLGSNYFGLDDMGKTIDAFSRALACAPSYDVIYQMQINSDLGSAYVSSKEYDQGINYIAKALEIAPNDGISHLNLGRAYAGKGDGAKAKASFEDALKYSPSDEFTAYVNKLLASLN
jgi:tetratricopeptide (TPR) repeat protein